MMPLDAIVLLGWMELNNAVRLLCEECIFDPPLTGPQAEDTWRRYKDAVDALPEREAPAPNRLALTEFEQEAANRFITAHRQRRAANILDVIKVDPSGLVVHQLMVVVERCRIYSEHVDAQTWCARNCLGPANPTQHNLQIRSGLNLADINVPHAEFAFVFVPGQGFQIQEMARHISVSACGNRMLLWAGYHRSYARMARTNPEAIDRSLLVVLTTDALFALSPASPNQGLREMVCGLRPPLMGDFLDDRFFMKIRLRKKRYQLQIRSVVVPVDDEP